MPKLKISDEEKKDRIVRACIAKYMELHHLSEEEVAIKMHFTKRTLQNKRKRPSTFTLHELRKLNDILKFTEEERAQLF